METQKPQQRLQFWLGIAVSLVCLVAIFVIIDPVEIWLALQTANYGYLVISALGITIFLFIRAIRWRFMLNNQAPYTQILHIQNIGYMLTNILPFRLGDVARAVLIGNVPPITLPQGISTMVVERVLDMLFFATLLPFVLAQLETFPPEFRTASQVAGILAITAIIILVIAANQRPLAQRLATAILDRIPFMDTTAWVKRLDEILQGLSSLTRLKDGLILIFLSIVVWIPIFIAYHTSLLAAQLQPSLVMTAFVVTAAAFSVAAPSSPGQVGVFHAAVIFALTEGLNQPEAQSASFAFLYHAVNFLMTVLLGIIGISRIGATFSNVVASTRAFVRKTPE